MREAEEREIFQNAVDRRLSGLQENPFLAQRIMNAEKGEIKVKKKLTMSMVLVIVLLLIAVTALAAGIIFAKRVPATEIADQALLKTYGITAQMQSLFIRETAEGEGGTTVVTYEGR